MKEAMQKATRSFARAIIQPVMFMAVSGLVISVAAIMKMEFMPGVLQKIGNFFFGIVSSGAIGSLSIIFAVGISAALAKKKKTDAAIIGVTSFMIFLYANNSWLTLTNRLAESGEQGLYGTGQNLVLGVQVNDMGVFLGIIIGCLVGYIINRTGDVKLHKYLSPYEGTKFSYAVAIFSTIALAIVITYVWPVINSGINFVVSGMTSMGPLGFFAYGFLNRMLLPLGMHHLLWMPLHFTPMGGTATIAGEQVSGAYNIWLASLGNLDSISQLDPSIGFLVNFAPLAFPIAIALAFIKTSKPENKAKVKAIVIPTVILAAAAGTTEPLEFLFLFTAPVLWLAHAIVFGLSFMVSDILGLKVMVGSIPETLPSLFVPSSLGHQYLIIPIGVGIALLEYFLFKTLILKFDLPTIGRRDLLNDDENSETLSEGQTTTKQEEQLAIIVEGLGGIDNIEEIFNCYSRLRLDVYDDKKVNIDLLKKYPSSGVVDKQKHIQIIIGIGVEDVRLNLENYVNDLKSGKKVLPKLSNLENQVSTLECDKKTSGELFAAAKGEIVPLKDVSDPAFSSIAIGNGYGIINHNGDVYSPITGKVISVFPTKHAICIEDKDGNQILVHMGIDTVELSGKPFEILIEEGQEVKQGTIIAKMDRKLIRESQKDDIILVINLENKNGEIVERKSTDLDKPIFKF